MLQPKNSRSHNQKHYTAKDAKGAKENQNLTAERLAPAMPGSIGVGNLT
jgi:hypothetical protein